MVGVPINYGAIRWVLDNKMHYLDGTMKDPNNQWTAQSLNSYLTSGVLYVLVVGSPSSLPFPPYLQFHPGPTRTLPRTDLPSPPLRLLDRCRHPASPLPPLKTLPKSQLPPLEQHHLLLRPLELLRQHLNRLPLVHHRRIHRHVLGVPEEVRAVG